MVKKLSCNLSALGFPSTPVVKTKVLPSTLCQTCHPKPLAGGTCGVMTLHTSSARIPF